MLTKDEKYMKMAVKLAKKAASMGEVPIGCVIVYEDKVIGRGYNRRKTDILLFNVIYLIKTKYIE